MAVVAAAVAVAWVVHASGTGSLLTLGVSTPQSPGLASRGHEAAAGGGPTGGVATRSGNHHVALTPAGVAQAAPSQVDSERPQTITLSSGTTMRVRVSSTASTGDLEIPVNIKQAGWWDGGSKLGDPFGAIVVAAHVDSFTQGLGRFAELLSMHSGDRIHLDSAHLAQTYIVVSAHLVPKTSISSTSSVFSARGRARLVLITCGGPYTRAGGYQSNMVVVAVPDGNLVSQ